MEDGGHPRHQEQPPLLQNYRDTTPGDRPEAIRYLANWIDQNVGEYLKICDPFFGPEELEFLKPLLSISEECEVQILTSRRHQVQERIPVPWDDAYRTYWRVNVSDLDPPDTRIVVVGAHPSGSSPIHDRWWVTGGGGLRIGTSLNSLGRGKESEIAVLTEHEAQSREVEIDEYLQFTRRDHNGERLRYEAFTL